MGEHETRKTVRFSVRFKPEEAMRIQKEAKENGLTVAGYLRMMTRQKANDHPEIRKQLKTLIGEVNHIGNNINQIVKNNNSNLYYESDKRRLYACMQKINLTLQEAVQVIGNL